MLSQRTIQRWAKIRQPSKLVHQGTGKQSSRKIDCTDVMEFYCKLSVPSNQNVPYNLPSTSMEDQMYHYLLYGKYLFYKHVTKVFHRSITRACLGSNPMKNHQKNIFLQENNICSKFGICHILHNCSKKSLL